MSSITKSPIHCEHANEVTVPCPCNQDCYCKQHTCKETTSAKKTFTEIGKEYLDPEFREAERKKMKQEEKLAATIRYIENRGAVDPEEFGGTDFPPITDFDQQIKELYDNPNVNGCDAWIQTYKGHKFFPQYPDKSVIDIEDIAHALSNQCRFGGHPKHHYSVAQHSILVSYLCQPENALYGLMHDCSEAYITDMPSPIKRLPELAGYCQLEKGIMRAILKHFGLPEQEPADVKQADLLVLGIEAQTFMSPSHADWKAPREAPPFLTIQVKSPEEVKNAFLLRFHQLTGYKYQYDRSEKYQSIP